MVPGTAPESPTPICHHFSHAAVRLCHCPPGHSVSTPPIWRAPVSDSIRPAPLRRTPDAATSSLPALQAAPNRSAPPHLGSKPLVAAVPAPSPRGITSRAIPLTTACRSATPRLLPDLHIGPRAKASLHHVFSPGSAPPRPRHTRFPISPGTSARLRPPPSAPDRQAGSATRLSYLPASCRYQERRFVSVVVCRIISDRSVAGGDSLQCSYFAAGQAPPPTVCKT
ncbi:hypothetical protein NDU88_003247 [Pleurodeles waltl]|uniref:Uncharacterized protein n=1 Tax=Pleurodeles waltl TaxID=8319 RepID=A0AAV7T5M8_PLEWA|nr:hypothetical protein NDU88_003247 [Pleurodeles waltl]